MPTDLWEDMETLNALYEELCWDPEKPLEFKADYENDQYYYHTQERLNTIEYRRRMTTGSLAKSRRHPFFIINTNGSIILLMTIATIAGAIGIGGAVALRILA